jgi:hypothetical protein
LGFESQNFSVLFYAGELKLRACEAWWRECRRIDRYRETTLARNSNARKEEAPKNGAVT